MQLSSDYKTDTYLITAISNLHAGSGDAEYGIIDKRVQKDVVSKLPTINSSSLKGALRELFGHVLGDKNHKHINDIFGSDKVEDAEGNESNSAGQYNFFSASLLVLPVRSDVAPFFRATSPTILKQFLEDLQRYRATDLYDKYKAAVKYLADYKVEKGKPVFFEAHNGKAVLEDLEAKEVQYTGEGYDLIQELLGDNLALFHYDDFKDLCEDLPVIARNNLENGVSTNLWYEEIVPRESRFYFFLYKPAAHTAFEETLEKKEGYAQIGGNASVGYGYCQLKKL
ncbi:MAG: type III-B CRISPR module RAMP protein Cmr4 [Chitinophagales bacterium]